jgi:tRNA pseudouridine synthase 9
LKTIGFKFSFQYVDFASGKPSKTVFERVSYNGRTSLVKCYPVTGRTHQLRVHLRYLGHPIANDPVYGRYTPWSHLLDGVDLHHHTSASCRFANVTDLMLEKTTFDTLDLMDGNPRCGECHGLLVPDPLPGQELGIWLHAQRYSGKHWSYTTNDKNLLPWTHTDFDGDRTIIPSYM